MLTEYLKMVKDSISKHKHAIDIRIVYKNTLIRLYKQALSQLSKTTVQIGNNTMQTNIKDIVWNLQSWDRIL